MPKIKSDDEYREIARGNVERNASWDEESSADTIYDDAYTLGFDALHDAGVETNTARRIAREVAMGYAQP